MADPEDRPSAPTSIPKYIREGLERQDPETLRTIAGFAIDLAEYQEAQLQRQIEESAVDDPEQPPDDWEQDEWTEVLEDVDAPSKATLTVKTINENDYYYYQWREGDAIKSAYVAPVSPSQG